MEAEKKPDLEFRIAQKSVKIPASLLKYGGVKDGSRSKN
jgi:hypothetical protein